MASDTGQRAGRWLQVALVAALLTAAACGEDDGVVKGALTAVGDASSSEVSAVDGVAEDGAALGDSLGSDGGEADAAEQDLQAEDAAEPGSDSLADDAEDAAESDSLADTAEGGDSAGDSAALQCPGQSGCACQSDADCPASGACLPTAQGKICAAPCISEVKCPTGTVCAVMPPADPSSTEDGKPLCVPKWPTLCDPCTKSSDCALPMAVPAACVSAASPAGSNGWFCGAACKSDSQCPQGYSCQNAQIAEGDSGGYCLPSAGECACSPVAIAEAASTSCASATTIGGAAAVCAGTRSCKGGSLSACDAPLPATETCDGLDNNCSGVADEGSLCDDANACTDDSCDPQKGCQHSANAAPCSDGDACTLGDVCSGAACKVTPKLCDDGFACSTDSCDKVTGQCAFALPTDATCGVQLAPYIDNFPCDATATAALWHRSGAELPAGSVRWSFGEVAGLPQAPTGSCALSVNNGKDLQCPEGQTVTDASADSPWIDASAVAPATPILLRFVSSGSWTAQHAATVAVRSPGGPWTEVAKVTPSASNSWTPLSFSIKGYSGSKLQFRLRLTGPCAAGQIGWSIDDFAVFADACSAAPCKSTETCATGPLGKAICTACKPGFESIGNQCADIDECAKASPCAATANCVNTPGSVTCTCKAGYQGDGKSCSDIDECATAKDDCDKTAVCVNQPGGFQCACPKDQVGDGKACFKKGSNAKAPAASCLEILTLYPGSPDGAYWLDVDGPASGAPSTSYYCDMKNGGWTLLIFDDFEDGTTKGWSQGKVQGCGDYGKMLGGVDVFGKGAAPSKTVAAPVHTQAKLALKYVRIDSWDGESAVVQINGNTVFSAKGNAKLIGNQCGKWNWDEDDWGVNWTGAHTAASATVTVTSTLDQGADDEAFAFDNAVLWVK